MAIIRWEVFPAPTGRFRSFYKRPWPTGHSKHGIYYSISCADEYIPAKLKIAKHKPLRLSFRDTNDTRGMLTFKREFNTLDELKLFAKSIDENALPR